MNQRAGEEKPEGQGIAALIAEVENRLQLNIFISIFFCQLAYSIVKSVDKPESDAHKILLKWAIVPTAYLLSYVFFEVGRCRITRWWLKCISAVLFVGTFLFVLPMALVSASEATWHAVEVWLGVLSFKGIPLIPMVLLIPILLGICAGTIRCAWGRGGVMEN